MRIFQLSFINLAFIFLFAVVCKAQKWEALNPPLNPFNGEIHSTTVDTAGDIYCAGDFTNNNNAKFVAKWNGNTWNELGSGDASLKANTTILTLASYAGNIFAAGGFTNPSHYTYVARWNGNTWAELGNDTTALNANGLIYSIAVDKSGNVYAAGGFTNVSGKYYVAKWNGTSWSEIGTGASALNANAAIFSLATDASGNVYAGGYFTDASGKEYVAKWDGSNWKELGTGSAALNANDFIQCIAVDNNSNVFAGGDFRNSNNEYYLAKWNGSTWSEVGNGTNYLHANNSINTIAIKGMNELYVAGNFTDAGNHYVAKWDGTTWSQVNNSQNALIANNDIESIQLDANNNIYTGGKFTNKSGHAFIAKWNGNGWSEPGSKGDPFYTGSRPIYQIVGDSTGNVYVSGYFTGDEGNYYLERWNGSGWNQLQPADSTHLIIPLDGNYINGKNCLAIDKSGNVYTVGYTAITNGYYCILKWDGGKWSVLEDFPNSLNVYTGISGIKTDKQDNIYVSGEFNDAAYGLCSLAKWDGKTWSRLPGSAADNISDFCVANDGNIYAYGGFTDEYGRSIIANYNPNKHYNWEEVRNGDSRFNAPGGNVFMAIATDSSNNLYVNGNFSDSTGKRYLAKWDGNAWSEFGVTNSLNQTLAIDGDKNTYSTAGTEYIGDCTVKKWNGTLWTGIGVPIVDNSLYPAGNLLATDAAGNVYTDAISNDPGVGSFIMKYGAIKAQPPIISAFNPTSGSSGINVTITGKNFTGTTSVSFGGTNAASFEVNDDSTITAIVGNGATGSVKIEAPAGKDSLQTFTYTCDSVKDKKPVITSVGDSILKSSTAQYYHWYLNNKELESQASGSIHVTDAGFYHVETSSNNICWTASLDYPVLINTRPLNDTLKLAIYPNPSSGNFTADIKLPQTTTVTTYTIVYDVSGTKILETNKLVFFGNEIKVPISINNKGTFFVKVFVNGDSRQQTVIIQ